MKRKADASGQFKSLLNEIGNESKVEGPVVDMLEKMWIGNRNKPVVKKAKNVTENLSDPSVDDAPIPAVNPDYPDLGLGCDDEEEKMFVNQKDDGSSNANLKKMEDLRTQLNYPAGNKPTAGAKAKQTKVADQKAAAREQLKIAQARIANAKNLAALILKKGLASREQGPDLVKQIAALDNKGYGLVKQLVASFKGGSVEGRQATASAKIVEESLSTPIHLAKPTPRGQSLIDQLASAPWEGVPPSGYEHNKYTSQG